MEFEGRALAGGTAEGEVVALAEPLSLWGGFDADSGTVIDRRHPQNGVALGGKVVVMPSGRGSSSTSSVLAEAIRIGTAPAAIILATPDPIIAVGAIVGAELYDRHHPIVVVDGAGYEAVARTSHARVEAGAAVARITTR